MRWASFPPSGLRRSALPQRTATLALVIAIHVALLLLLLRLATPLPPPPKPESSPVSFELLPQAPPAPARTRTTTTERERASSGAPPRPTAPARVADAPEPPPTPATQAPSAIWQQVIPLTREELAAADVARMPQGRGAGEAAGAGSDTGSGDSADVAGGGTGGDKLYDPDWLRRPTRAELAFYLPSGSQPSGWGMVACQTAPDNRVENCREIGQSPGSGLAGAVRQAAWQFRVRPPRIGGRPLIGAWVRIRIDYIRGEGADRR